MALGTTRGKDGKLDLRLEPLQAQILLDNMATLESLEDSENGVKLDAESLKSELERVRDGEPDTGVIRPPITSEDE